MKMSIHLRFAAYALCLTVGFSTLLWAWDSPLPAMLLLELIPLALKLIGKKAFFEFHREVSDRELICGFFIFLLLAWAGCLYVAFHISPGWHPMRLLLAGLVVVWLLCVYPGYRWWRAQTASSA
jgi:hypothetical protein